jgi:prepilin-type N-terminal cleavage/methylation domain-containing protein
MKNKQHLDRGFTLIEIMMVVMVLGILATIAYATVGQSYKQKAYYTRAIAELNAMGNAASLYVSKYNDYPADVVRDVPADLKEFVQGQENIDEWPKAPWPGSVYDYDNWPPDSNGPNHTYQISIRLCNAGDTATCKKNANKYLKEYVTADTLANWDSYSSVYYCIKGSCRSHQSKPMSHPGYCINCGETKSFIN